MEEQELYTNGKLVPHLIRLDFGEIEVTLYHQAILGTDEALIIESALIAAFLRGLELPKEQFTHECYPIPEYDLD